MTAHTQPEPSSDIVEKARNLAHLLGNPIPPDVEAAAGMLLTLASEIVRLREQVRTLRERLSDMPDHSEVDAQRFIGNAEAARANRAEAEATSLRTRLGEATRHVEALLDLYDEGNAARTFLRSESQPEHHYLSMDCPSCGRKRVYAWVDGQSIKVRCDKCEATQWDCDEAEHRRGGPHAQYAQPHAEGER